jgi:hypothetical protein
VDSTQPAPTRTLRSNPRRPIWAWPPEAMTGTAPPPSLGVRATSGAPSRAYKVTASSSAHTLTLALLLPRLRRRTKPPSRAVPSAPLRRFAECVALQVKLTLPRASSCRHEAVMPHAIVGGAPERRCCMKPEPVTMADRHRPVSARSPSLPPPVSRPTRSPRFPLPSRHLGRTSQGP